MKEEVTKDLLSDNTFAYDICILRHAITDYLEYIMRLIDDEPLPNRYYERVKHRLDAQNDLKQSLISRGITDEKDQGCSVLTLSAIYYLINDKWVDLVLRRINNVT